MIRINLLPGKKSAPTVKIQQELLVFAGILAVVVAGCFVWWALKQREADALQATKKAKESELVALDKVIGEVNEFTQKKKELEDKLNVISSLKRGKTGPVRALDDLAQEIPNRVWLLGMEEVGGSVAFTGNAADHEDVSAFMKALQKSKYFKGVTLGYSKAGSTTQGTQFYEFKITCTVDYAA